MAPRLTFLTYLSHLHLVIPLASPNYPQKTEKEDKKVTSLINQLFIYRVLIPSSHPLSWHTCELILPSPIWVVLRWHCCDNYHLQSTPSFLPPPTTPLITYMWVNIPIFYMGGIKITSLWLLPSTEYPLIPTPPATPSIHPLPWHTCELILPSPIGGIKMTLLWLLPSTGYPLHPHPSIHPSHDIPVSWYSHLLLAVSRWHRCDFYHLQSTPLSPPPPATSSIHPLPWHTCELILPSTTGGIKMTSLWLLPSTEYPPPVSPPPPMAYLWVDTPISYRWYQDDIAVTFPINRMRRTAVIETATSIIRLWGEKGNILTLQMKYVKYLKLLQWNQCVLMWIHT